MKNVKIILKELQSISKTFNELQHENQKLKNEVKYWKEAFDRAMRYKSK